MIVYNCIKYRCKFFTIICCSHYRTAILQPFYFGIAKETNSTRSLPKSGFFFFFFSFLFFFFFFFLKKSLEFEILNSDI